LEWGRLAGCCECGNELSALINIGDQIPTLFVATIEAGNLYISMFWLEVLKGKDRLQHTVLNEM
jgi:hypothetical protein